MGKFKTLLAYEIAEQLSKVVLRSIKIAAQTVPSGKGYCLSETTSNFIKSLDVIPNPTDDTLVRIVVPSYVRYIESGRPAHAPKVPVKALINWANAKRIPADNATIFAIREAIYRDGIAPRPMLEAIDQAAHQAIQEFKPNITKALISKIKEQIKSWFNH